MGADTIQSTSLSGALIFLKDIIQDTGQLFDIFCHEHGFMLAWDFVDFKIGHDVLPSLRIFFSVLKCRQGFFLIPKG